MKRTLYKQYIQYTQHLLTLALGSALVLVSACKQDPIAPFEPVVEDTTSTMEPTPTAGSLDLSVYVAIGNSLTAGVSDGALYNRSQQNSYPSILAEQFVLAGGGPFLQPDINSENGFTGYDSTGAPLGRLKLNADFIPEALPGDELDVTPLPEATRLNLGNWGVPGINALGSVSFGAGGGTPGAFYNRMAIDINTSTPVNDALSRNPTFFTLWLGGNDALPYAISGASVPALLTSTADFATTFDGIVERFMNETSAKGAIANLAEVTDIPYFNLVPWNGLELTREDADSLNAIYALFNAALVAHNDTVEAGFQRPTLSFSAGSGNAYVLIDSTLFDLGGFGIAAIRQAEETDLISLSASGAQAAFPELALGSFTPFTEDLYLTRDESVQIQARLHDFNGIIEDAIDRYPDRLVLVDMNFEFTLMRVRGGVLENDIFLEPNMTPPFGIISLDGIHPNPRGYAFIANRFFEALNQKFGATFNLVDVGEYEGNEIP